MAKFFISWSANLLFVFQALSRKVMSIRNTHVLQYVKILIENVYFRTPEEKWYTYPAWLFLHIQVTIIPVIWFSAISTKILMRKEMKRYLFGNSIHHVHE